MANPWDNDPVVGGKTTSPEEFSMVYGPVAERIGKAIGVDPKIVLGQLGLETGWGKSIIPGTNNLGNIKDFAGGGVAATDNMTGSRDKYRAYASPEAFADDYASLIQRKFPDAVNAGSDASKFTAGLKGYAEDPRYPTKVAAAAKIAGAGTPTAPAAGTGNPWDNDPIVDAPVATPTAEAKPAKRYKTGVEKVINAVAAVTNPLGGLVDMATGGKASIGAARGAKDMIDTGAELLAKGYDKITGQSPGVSSLVTGQPQGEGAKVAAMNRAGKEDFAQTYGDSTAANISRLAGNVAATIPVTSALGAGAAAVGLPRLGAAIGSGGMTTGAGALPTLGAKAADMGIRMAGGAIAGGTSAGAIDPASAGTGAAIGAAMPPVVKGLGMAGSAIGRTLRGPNIPENVLAAASQAQEAGYVIPPTQVRPSLGNRLLEGMSGKITTAQNASARNQEVTNELAKRAIGASELTPEGLSAVRQQANAAYSALGDAGEFAADNAFREAMKKVGGPSAQLKKDFPGLANKELESLVESFTNTGTFNAQSAIEAIKDLRFAQQAGRNSQDPAIKAASQAKGKIAAALEDLVDRNLQAQGNTQLLDAYRAARQILAKTYDVEKAMNPASGSIDANKLASLLKKGRPLSGDLETIANFASAFPKAAQTVERMGSLPQLSPLDWAAAGGMSAATGSPLGMVGLVARPAARAATLSGPVQRGLTTPNRLLALTSGLDESYALPLYRAAPLLGSSR